MKCLRILLPLLVYSLGAFCNVYDWRYNNSTFSPKVYEKYFGFNTTSTTTTTILPDTPRTYEGCIQPNGTPFKNGKGCLERVSRIQRPDHKNCMVGKCKDGQCIETRLQECEIA
uniref:Evasin n=1 Tax=Rhipicephalus zambeziensis TaxID=60191 RepID=A0A224YJM4_9ACAR